MTSYFPFLLCSGQRLMASHPYYHVENEIKLPAKKDQEISCQSDS